MKAPLWIISLLPFLAIAVYYALGLSHPKDKETGKKSNLVAVPNANSSQQFDQSMDLASWQKRSEKRETEMREHEDNIAKLAGDLDVVEVKRRVDSIMASRQPKYQAAFDSWSLSPSQATDVWAIIKEREVRLVNDRLQFLKDKDMNAYMENITIREAEIEVRLVSIMGQKNYGTLVQMESDFKTRAVEAARAHAAD